MPSSLFLPRRVASTGVLFFAWFVVSNRARADTTLTVDLATTLRPVTHAASGSLYGVTEKIPADVNGLIAPLHPFVFNNPAADVQQPVGDAIVVAGRVASTGAKVSIRLADLYPGWPYKFTSVSDWLTKVSQTVSRKKASGLKNYYGYEIWNEPNGTWTSSTSFNDFWKQTYLKLRELDPDANIIGPSLSFYDANNLKSFLTFAKANDCVPDIISWHELSGGNLTSNFQNYRALERQLGVGPLPISINEYSGKDDLAVEGQPGASAPLIAKFERFKVDSACISYWDVPHPGRLGSLLATDTAKNGGWWFYKWYGDMSGNMVATTPPSPNDATALDGFASLDLTQRVASVVLGGVNDGTVRVVVKGFGALSSFGPKVHAVVEHTPFVNRSTPVNATDTLSTADLDVINDQVTVSISKANATDGYRVSLSALGMTEAAGAGGMAAGGAASGSAASAAGRGNEVAGIGHPGDAGKGGTESAGTAGLPMNAGAGGPPTSGGGALNSPATAETANNTSSAGATSSRGGADAAGCSCRAAGRTTRAPGWFTILAALSLSFLGRHSRPRRGGTT